MDTVNQILTIEEHNKIKKLIGKCSHLLVREVFSMKSKRLLILLAPLTFGINAETVPVSVTSSTPAENVIVKTETQTPKLETISDLSSKNAGIPEAQTQNVTVQNEAKEAASSEVLPEKVEQQPPVLPLPEHSKEAELVNQLFDKGEQEVKSKIDIAASETKTPQGGVQGNTVNATPLGVSSTTEDTVQSATSGATASTSIVSQANITSGATPTSSVEVQPNTTPGTTQTSSAVPQVTTNGETVTSSGFSQTNTTTGESSTPFATVSQTTIPATVYTSTIPGSYAHPPLVIPATKFPPEDATPVVTASSSVTPQVETPPVVTSTQSPTLSQYSNDNFRLLQSGSLTLSANSPQQTNPEIAQNTLGQTSGVQTAEIVKENVSDFLVSQAQNKINAAQTQPNCLTNKEVQEIRSNIDRINEDVASIKENINVLTVAITDKSGKLGSALDKVEETSISSDGKDSETYELLSQEWENKLDDLNECDETKILDLNESQGNSVKLSDEKEKLSEIEKNEQTASKSPDKMETFLKTEEATPDSSSNSSALKTDVLNKDVEKSGVSEYSQILQELKEVNQKVNIIDDKVDKLYKNDCNARQLTAEEVKKKIISEQPAYETMQTERTNAELLETSLINTRTSSDRHEDYIANQTQSKTEGDTSSPEPAAQNNIKTEEANQTKTDSDTQAKEPATQGGGKLDEAKQTNVENESPAKEHVTNDGVQSDELSQTKAESTDLAKELSAYDIVEASKTKTEGNTSVKKAIKQDTVKMDEATQTEVTNDTATKEAMTNSTVKPDEAKDNTSVAAPQASSYETKDEEKSPQLPQVSTRAGEQPSSSVTALTEEPMRPTTDASKELKTVKELTSKLKTTMQTISLAKSNLMRQNS